MKQRVGWTLMKSRCIKGDTFALTMAGKSSSSQLNSSGPNQLQIVGAVTSASIAHNSSASSFELPDGWTVEKRPRRSINSGSSHFSDTYYYEPGSGRQFRSKISIQRYLNGETILECRQNSIKCSNKNNMQIIPTTPRSGTEFNLPEGWLVLEQPRKNVNYAGHIDRYYIEPGTKKRFRSRLSVERHLAERQGYAAVTKGLTQNDQSTMQIVPRILRSGTEFNLPEGWLVEEQPRKNVNYAGHVDKYYIEPGTKKRFRSQLSVDRHLAEKQGCSDVRKGQTQEDQSTKVKLVSEQCAMTIVIKHPTEGVKKFKPLRALEAGNCPVDIRKCPMTMVLKQKSFQASRLKIQRLVFPAHHQPKSNGFSVVLAGTCGVLSLMILWSQNQSSKSGPRYSF